MSAFKKILNNATLMSWASKFTGIGSMVFVTPLFISVYTPSEYAFWGIISTIIIYANLADSGFGSALERAVSYFRAGADALPKTKEEYDRRERIKEGSPNIKQLKKLLSTTTVIYWFLSVLTIVLLVLAVFVVWNIIESENHRMDFWLAYLLLIPLCMITISTVKWTAFLRGLNQVAFVERYNTLLGSFRIIVFTVFLLNALYPVYLVSYMLVVSIIRFFYFRHQVLKWISVNDKTHTFKRFYFDREIFRSLWPQTWRLAGIFWGNFFVEKGDMFIIAQIPDPLLISNYYLTKRIIGFVKTFSFSAFTANLPTIYKLSAEKNFKLLKEKTSQYIFFALIIMIMAFVFVGSLGNPILDFLVNIELISTEIRFVPTVLFVLMSVIIFLEMHHTFHASIYSSTNHIPFLIPAIVSGIVIMSLSYYFSITLEYGLIGIILVRLFTQIAFNNWYAPYLSLRFLQWPFYKYIYEFPKTGSKFLFGKIKSIIRHVLKIK